VTFVDTWLYYFRNKILWPIHWTGDEISEVREDHATQLQCGLRVMGGGYTLAAWPMLYVADISFPPESSCVSPHIAIMDGFKNTIVSSWFYSIWRWELFLVDKPLLMMCQSGLHTSRKQHRTASKSTFTNTPLTKKRRETFLRRRVYLTCCISVLHYCCFGDAAQKRGF